MITPRDMLARRTLAEQASVSGCGQRFGRIADRKPSPAAGRGVVSAPTSATTRPARPAPSATPISSPGFRTIRAGERIRFLTDSSDPSHAGYVIRLDLPDVEEYYQ
jgi:hypothetical protein